MLVSIAYFTPTMTRQSLNVQSIEGRLEAVGTDDGKNDVDGCADNDDEGARNGLSPATENLEGLKNRSTSANSSKFNRRAADTYQTERVQVGDVVRNDGKSEDDHEETTKSASPFNERSCQKATDTFGLVMVGPFGLCCESRHGRGAEDLDGDAGLGK